METVKYFLRVKTSSDMVSINHGGPQMKKVTYKLRVKTSRDIVNKIVGSRWRLPHTH